MILSMLLLQAAAAAASPAARERYEPFKNCLAIHAGIGTASGESDEEALERARSKCRSENLSSGSAALFAEMDNGATREQAVERVASLRAEAEAEAPAARRAAAAGPPALVRAPFVRRVPGGADRVMDIPDEIAPAIIPYLLCLNASKGVPVYNENKTVLVAPPRGILKGSDCSAVRTMAAADADPMLKRARGGGRAERTAFIENTLVALEKFTGSVPAPQNRPTE